MKVMTAVQQFRVWVRNHINERGSSIIEYVLLVSLIAVVCLIAVSHLGTATNDVYSQFADSVASVS